MDFFELACDIAYSANGDVDLEVLAPMLSDVCTGMQYLHARNIVHGGVCMCVRACVHASTQQRKGLCV